MSSAPFRTARRFAAAAPFVALLGSPPAARAQGKSIQLSDDPFPTLRAAVYALSVQHRARAPTPPH